MDKTVDIVAPLISVALVGVESRNQHFNNQKSLFDDLLNIRNRDGWNRSGYTPWIDIPDALGFEDDVEYRVSLVAYYLALHIHELAVEIAAGREISSSEYHFNVPLDFLTEKNEIKQQAILLLLRNPALPELWMSLDVTLDQMKNSWNNWISCCRRWLMGVYRNHWYGFDPMPHQNFFENL